MSGVYISNTVYTCEHQQNIELFYLETRILQEALLTIKKSLQMSVLHAVQVYVAEIQNHTKASFSHSYGPQRSASNPPQTV